MPIVPEFTHGIENQPLGPNISVAGAGAQGEALATAARYAGDQIQHTYMQIKEDEAQGSALTSQLQIEQQATQIKEQVEQNSKGGYVTDKNGEYVFGPDGGKLTTTQAIHDQYDELYKKHQEMQPSARAQDLLQDRAGPWLTTKIDQSLVDEYKSRSKYNEVLLSTAAEARKNLLTENSSPVEIYSALHDVRDIVLTQPGISGTDKAVEMQRQEADTVRAGMRAGLQQVMAAPPGEKMRFIMDRLAFLRGEDTETKRQAALGIQPAFLKLKAEDRDTLEHEYERLKQFAAATDASDARIILAGVISGYQSGRPDQVALAQKQEQQFYGIQARLSQVNSGHYSPIHNADDLSKIRAAKAIGRINGGAIAPPPTIDDNGVKIYSLPFDSKSPQERRSIADMELGNIPVRGVGGEAQGRAADYVDTELDKLDRLEKNQFSAYTELWDDQSQIAGGLNWAHPDQIKDPTNAWGDSARTKRVVFENHNGPATGHIELLNHKNAQAFKDFLSQTQGDDGAEVASKNAAIKNLRALTDQAPGSLDDVVAQLSGSGPKGSRMNPAWILALNTPDDATREQIIQGIVLPANKDHEVNLWKSAPANDGKIKTLMQKIGSNQVWKMQTMIAEDPDGVRTRESVNAMSDATANKGIRLMADSSKKVSAMDAESQAGAIMLDSQGVFRRDFVNGDGAYDIRLPRGTSKEDGDAVRVYTAKALLDPKSLGLVIPPPPPGWQGADKAVWDKQWLASVTKFGQFRSTRDSKALTLFLRYPGQREARAQTTTSATSGNSSLLYVPFDDAVREGRRLIKAKSDTAKAATAIQNHAGESNYLPTVGGP